MAHRSWKARVMRNQPKPAPRIAIVQDAIATSQRAERERQGELVKELSQRHGWDIPVPDLWKLRAIRLGSVC